MRRRSLSNSLELTPELLSKGVSTEFQSSLHGTCQTEALSNFLPCRRSRREHNGRRMTTSAARVHAASAMKFVDAHDFVSQEAEVLEEDGQMKRAKGSPVPLHVTANASMGNSHTLRIGLLSSTLNPKPQNLFPIFSLLPSCLYLHLHPCAVLRCFKFYEFGPPN